MQNKEEIESDTYQNFSDAVCAEVSPFWTCFLTETASRVADVGDAPDVLVYSERPCHHRRGCAGAAPPQVQRLSSDPIRRSGVGSPPLHETLPLQHLESTRDEARGESKSGSRDARAEEGRRSGEGDSSSDSPHAADRTEGAGCCCVRPGAGRPSWQSPRGGLWGQANAREVHAAALPRGVRACAVPLRTRRAATVECKLGAGGSSRTCLRCQRRGLREGVRTLGFRLKKRSSAGLFDIWHILAVRSRSNGEKRVCSDMG